MPTDAPEGSYDLGMRLTSRTLGVTDTLSDSYWAHEMSCSSLESSDSGYTQQPWLPDDLCGSCMKCQLPFGLWRWTHHCRVCGGLYCRDCSSHRVESAGIGLLECIDRSQPRPLAYMPCISTRRFFCTTIHPQIDLRHCVCATAAHFQAHARSIWVASGLSLVRAAACQGTCARHVNQHTSYTLLTRLALKETHHTVLAQ